MAEKKNSKGRIEGVGKSRIASTSESQTTGRSSGKVTMSGNENGSHSVCKSQGWTRTRGTVISTGGSQKKE